MQKINKILLMVPPVITSVVLDINPLPPMGLGYLSSVLKKIGIDVIIYDSLIEYWNEPKPLSDKMIYIGPDENTIKKVISKVMPDIIGVSSQFSCQSKNAHAVYRCAKEVNPKIITIAGGAHPTVLPEKTLEDENVDFVVIGEGEKTILDIINYLNGKFNSECFDGVGYRKDGEIIIKPKTRFIEDLDELTFPDWESMHVERYFGLESSHGTRIKDRFMPLITSRGCTASCSFCTAHCVWGRRYRKRSVENIIAEMKLFKEKYGIEEIMFEDDNVTLDPGRAKKLFQRMIDEKLNFIWDTPNGVAAWTLDEEILELMKKSGCFKLNLAIESGSQDVLDNLIRKPVNLVKIVNIINKAREIDLPVSSFFIVGLPGETIDQIKETFYFSARNKFYRPHVSIATPYPGSDLYDECQRENLFLNDYNLENLHIHTFNLKSDNWTIDELKRTINWGFDFLYQQRAKDDLFYFLGDLWMNILNPKYCLGRILDMINPSIKIFIKKGLNMKRGSLYRII